VPSPKNWPPSQDSLQSGAVVVPLVMRLIHPSSVVDFGCKLGEWLSLFAAHGVSDMLGLDREHRTSDLVIPSDSFRGVDLTHPFALGRTYDLAICLEVAEHLPRHAALPLVAQLTRSAPVVLFSAAIPGQGGHGHVNEQPHEYWHALFRKAGFETLDCIRPAIWQDAQVAYWYRQNMFLYARPAAIEASPALGAERDRRPATDMRLIHDEVLRNRRLRAKVVRYMPASLTRMLVAGRRLVAGAGRPA
jgi:hypothetical protein